MEAFFGKILSWIGAIYPAVLGSALAIFNGDATKLTKSKMAATFLFGVHAAYFCGGAAIEYFHINPNSYVGSFILFAFGVMGMGMLAEAMLQIPLFLTIVRKKFLGE